jgi:hypothetical protein
LTLDRFYTLDYNRGVEDNMTDTYFDWEKVLLKARHDTIPYAFSCSPELRYYMMAAAEEKNISASELMRQVFVEWLSKRYPFGLDWDEQEGSSG